MEVNTQRRKAGLDEKMPDIQKTLEAVRLLKTRRVSTSHRCAFPHTDGAYHYTARFRTFGDDIRTERYPLRQSARPTYRRGVSLAGCKRYARLSHPGG